MPNRITHPLWLALALLLSLASCTTTTWVNTGGYWLESVDTPDSVPHPSLSDEGIYADDNLSIHVEMDVDGFALTLRNNTTSNVRIHWDACSYTDELGTVHPVMHNQVDSYAKGAWQTPTLVSRGKTLEDFVAPSDHLTDDGYDGLSMQPLWSIHSYTKKKEAVAARPVESAALLTLALEMNGVTSDYVFRFAGDDYQTEAIREVDYGKTVTAWNIVLDAIIVAGVILALVP